MKIEMANEKGREITKARNEVSSVPTRKGSAPNVCVTGFHVLPNTNERPKARSAGREFTNKLKQIAPSNTRIERAENQTVF